MVRVPFLVRAPGRVPAGKSSDALQSQVDLAPTFLSLAGLPAPRCMTGVDQGAVWEGRAAGARDHVLVENHHQPTTIHVKTLIDERYKITVYFNRDYGELFDLAKDPGERRNLWFREDCSRLKAEMTRKLLFALMGAEPMLMPRVAVA